LTQVIATRRRIREHDACTAPVAQHHEVAMEFHIRLDGATPDPVLIEDAIRAIDPAALVDIDPASPTLRIATSLDARQLVSLVAEAGYAVTADQVTQLPSICCGGCSG
jgi:hypothetical protein